MHSIELVLVMLLAVLASGYLVRISPVSLPLPLVQIGLGAVIAGVFNHGVKLDPDFFFLFFLPPLLFLDGWRIPKVGLFRDKNVILPMAFGLVFFTVFGLGFLIHWMIPNMPLAVAFALAAIVSPTDPVAVSSIAARVPIPKRLMHILEGESLLNDASGLVCFQIAVAAVLVPGTFSLAGASMEFIWLVLIGIAIGIFVTFMATSAQSWISRHFGEEVGTPILLSLLLPFGAYLLAEHLNASGILAAVAAGITMSYVELSGHAVATTRIQRTAVWNTLQFTLNGIIFVLLGEQLPAILRNAATSAQQSGHASLWWLVVYTLAINLGLAALRVIWSWASFRLSLLKTATRTRRLNESEWRVILVAALSGVRGAVTLAGVFTLPLLLKDGIAFPARDLAIFLAAGVILTSLITASLALPGLLKKLKFPEEAVEHQEEDYARTKAAAAAISAIEHAQQGQNNDEDADIYTAAAARVMALYQHRIEGRSPGVSKVDAEALKKADRAELEFRLAGLKAEREEIFHLARSRLISDETSRKLVNEIDLQESRYR